jgi:hypothetical protein
VSFKPVFVQIDFPFFSDAELADLQSMRLGFQQIKSI